MDLCISSTWRDGAFLDCIGLLRKLWMNGREIFWEGYCPEDGFFHFFKMERRDRALLDIIEDYSES